MISLLCPTRFRPQLALKLYQTFRDTQDGKNELIFCLQKEDPKIKQYLEVFKANNITKFFISESMPTSYLWNQMALQAKGDLMTLVGDDVEILTQGWDTKIEEAANKIKDNIFVLTVDDGRKDKPQGQYMRCPHPTMHRKWLETLGYFVPPFFMHRYLDTYTQSLALKLNRFIELPEVVFNHLKFDHSNDDTGVRSRNWLNYDKYVYEKISHRYFNQDLDALKKSILK